MTYFPKIFGILRIWILPHSHRVFPWSGGWGKEVQVHVGLWVIYLVGGFNNNSGYNNNNSDYKWLYDGIITYTYLVGG